MAIAEAACVLASKHTHHLDRPTIRAGLLPLIEFPGLLPPGKGWFPRVFDLCVSHPIDVPDAFHAALI
jgi:hypothetical protein